MEAGRGHTGLISVSAHSCVSPIHTYWAPVIYLAKNWERLKQSLPAQTTVVLGPCVLLASGPTPRDDVSASPCPAHYPVLGMTMPSLGRLYAVPKAHLHAQLHLLLSAAL